MTAVMTTETRNGRPVVVKRAAEPAAAARLEREAALLAGADHPGVIALVAVEHEAETVALVTSLAGVRTLGDALELGDVRAAAVVAALAETVADLHDLGLVHNRIDGSHVILAADDRPVLCGFAEAQRTGEGADASADVQALGVLLLEIAGSSADGLGRRLRSLGERATATAAEGGPTAREIAASLHQLVPAPDHDVPRDARDPMASLRRGLAAAAGPGRWSPSRRQLLGGAAAAVAAAAVVVGLGVLGRRGGGAEAAAPPPPPAVDVTAATTTSTRPRPDRVWPPPSGPLVVQSDGARFEVGQAGDRMAIGDWNCDGTATPALLRPTTGEVFVFPAWATAGRGMTVEPAQRVAGAYAIVAADPDGDGCHDLIVEAPGGTEVVR